MPLIAARAVVLRMAPIFVVATLTGFHRYRLA